MAHEVSQHPTHGTQGESVSDWIAITGKETGAPFDGEPVLILTNNACFGRVHRVRWTDDVHGEGIFGWAVDDCKFGPYALRGYTIVTHWMRLPAPPEHDDAAPPRRGNAS